MNIKRSILISTFIIGYLYDFTHMIVAFIIYGSNVRKGLQINTQNFGCLEYFTQKFLHILVT